MRADYDEEKGHYHRDGEDIYVDSNLVNSSKNVIPDSELVHYGFGEFAMRTPGGKIDFDRINGKDFEGQYGRSHRIYDNAGGKLVKELLEGMADKIQEV